MSKRMTAFKTTGAALAISLVSSIASIVSGQTPSAVVRVAAEDKGSAAVTVSGPRSSSAAADYAAPKKPMPPLVRVGVEASEPMPLTLNEAIRLALANNNDIATSRIDVEISEDDLTAA